VLRLVLESFAGCVIGVLTVAASAEAQTAAPRVTDVVQRAIDRTHRGICKDLDVWQDHSQWENAWVARTPHFTVRTTKSHALARELGTGLEVMLGHFRDTLGVDHVPAQPFAVFVFATIAEYNAFGNANGQEHSSFYGSFHAVAHAESPVAAVWHENPILLRMQVTHSVVHQWLHSAFPGRTLPVWLDEGLAAYFTTFWDQAWSLAEYRRLRSEGRLVKLDRILGDGIAAYGLDTHARFVALGQFFHWMLRHRDDTRTSPPGAEPAKAPFRDHVVALLNGTPPLDPAVERLLADRAKLAAEFAAFEFPE
jgi:hypothetical protein